MKKFVIAMALLALATSAYATAPADVFWNTNDGWSNTVVGGSTITVSGTSITLASTGSGSQIRKDFTSAYLPGTGEIDIHLNFTPLTSNASTLFYLWLGDASGSECRWRFGDDWTKFSGTNGTSAQLNATGVDFGSGPPYGGIGTSNDADLKILTGGPQATAVMSLNGVSVGALNLNMLTGLKSIRLELLGNNGMSARIDNLTVGTTAVPEPSSLAALGVFGMGLIGTIRRRRS